MKLKQMNLAAYILPNFTFEIAITGWMCVSIIALIVANLVPIILALKLK